ncbi:MAG: hypothetical protein M1817_001861 [Caeruleum heppii]|nr:MAG: hypothetical protein M1817_001861 [Caeruleum heppii]
MIHSSEGDPAAPLKPGALLGANPLINPPSLTSIASAGLRTSPVPKSPKAIAALSPRSLIPLTGATARTGERRRHDERDRMQDRQQSPNPATSALDALLRPRSGVSKPQDAPRPTETTSEGLSIAANAVTIPDPMQVDNKAQTSPVSASSVGSFQSRAPTATANSVRAESPPPSGAPTESEHNLDDARRRQHWDDAPSNAEARSSNRAFTFPGKRLDILPQDDAKTPVRGMSLPMPEAGKATRTSSGSKKHKCPYCATEFTRHHNLKSHLLTHSHEKPFVCSTCQQRFRRLHDLKRHTKLHTGERPHICPKCKRRFARGDALARHNKGHGGCAGRRSSMGSYGGNEDMSEAGPEERETAAGDAGSGDGMDGVVYGGDDSPTAERMDDDGELANDRRRLSLPGIRAQDLPTGGASQQNASSPSIRAYSPERAPSTYPPAARHALGAQTGERPAPLSNLLGGSSHAASPARQRDSRSPRAMGLAAAGAPATTAGGAPVFGPGGMTESPKPLSPGAAASHQLGVGDASAARPHQSPNLTQHFQHPHYNRRGTGSGSSPMGLPPISGHSQAPQLPSLPGLAPSDARFTLPSQAVGGAASGQTAVQTAPAGYQQSVSGAAPTSAISHSTSTSLGGSASSHGQMTGEIAHHPISAHTDGLWTYVRNLEERLNRLADEVVGLRDELANRQRREGVGRG